MQAIHHVGVVHGALDSEKLLFHSAAQQCAIISFASASLHEELRKEVSEKEMADEMRTLVKLFPEPSEQSSLKRRFEPEADTKGTPWISTYPHQKVFPQRPH